MDKYTKRKAIIKGQFTKMANFIDANGSDLSYDELKTRLEHAHRLYSDFVCVEDNIFAIDDSITSEMDLIFENYFSIVSKIQALLRQTAGTNSAKLDDSINSKVGIHAASDFKLPSLSMPNFDGNLQEWQSFFDIFTSTIHENTSLTPAQKFKYLKGLLKGSAYDLIRHFRVDDASYVEAYQRLVKRYNKRKPIVESYIQSLFNQPKLSKANASSLTQLHDHLDEVIRGLKALGHDAEARDPWLIFIVLERLDEETKRIWKYETAESDFPTLQELLDFLLKRTSALSGGNACVQKPPVAEKRVISEKRLPSQPQSSAKIFHIPTTLPCPLCHGESHRLFECPKFTDLTIDQRREFLKTKSRCFNCLSDTHSVYQCKTKRRCRICSKKHNTLVHLNMQPNADPTPVHTSSSTPVITAHASCCDDPSSSQNNSIAKAENALLPTAVFQIRDGCNVWQDIRGLLDSASTRSFITESCVNRLQLARSNARVIIETINKSKTGSSRGVANVRLRSRLDHTYAIDVATLIVSNITSNLPANNLPERASFQVNLPLADPKYNESGPIDMLLGCDHFLNIIIDGKLTNTSNNLVALNTKFGWIIGGVCDQMQREDKAQPVFFTKDEEINIDRLLRRFWEIEEIVSQPLLSEEETKCIKYYESTVTKDNRGRIVVSLPFKNSRPRLGDSFNQARVRFYSLERKLAGNQSLRKQYHKFMEEYLSLGHMELVPPNEITLPVGRTFYLLHHGVLKNSSSTTKLRVVFDGSAKTANGRSLNDELMIGPTVQQTIIEILGRYRKYKYVFSADVEKMYRQFMVQKSDVNFQRILWRESPNLQLNHYRLLTVTYGTSSAPFLATFSLHHIADRLKHNFPRVANIIKKDFYVDDLMSGANSLKHAVEIQRELIQALQLSGLKLRKWSANHTDLLNWLPTDDVELTEREFDNGLKAVQILGIYYQPKQDVFKFRINLSESSHTTKRQLLSEASRLFDPMGWLSPVIIILKMLFQKLWLEKLDWDDAIPPSHQLTWSGVRTELKLIETFEIPRWLEIEEEFEIHGFADASKEAYAAVLYSRSKLLTGEIKVNLITAKTKVAPIKTISIPKLELCAAALLVKLLEATIKSLDLMTRPKVYLYTDSTIVLHWLSKQPKSWPTYISNRTSQILTTTNRNQWYHINSKENPADCASRGLSPKDLQNYELWWKGPPFLQNDPVIIPRSTQILNFEDEDLPEAVVTATCTVMYDVGTRIEHMSDRISRYPIILRVLARIKRLASKANHIIAKNEIESIEVHDLAWAETRLLSLVQYQKFGVEIETLKSGMRVTSGKLVNFLPFIDNAGLLRVSGRISKAPIPYDAKHPIILPGDHPTVLKLIKYLHLKLLHAETSQLLSHIRQRFQILRCKESIRKVIFRCMKCHRQKLKTQTQLMGQLPSSRVTLSRPFLRTGVDYAGPYMIKAHQQRNSKLIKGYLALFVCMATKAVHFELVTSLSTESFIAALTRFQAVRGICADIYSDNGTNFIGARNHLEEIVEFFNSKDGVTKVTNWASEQGTKWHFIPPAAPTFGGLWEAAVKSTKFHIRRVIGDTTLNYEELLTLLKQIEAVLNSRPLCRDDVSDDPLTPAHFLIGHSLSLAPEPTLINKKQNLLSRWQLLQKMLQHFWQRWRVEYLSSLNKFSKWNKVHQQPKPDDIVILRDDNVPPARWPLAKVITTHPGSDNFVRVVTLKTSKGIYKRPIQKICILPKIDSSESREAE